MCRAKGRSTSCTWDCRPDALLIAGVLHRPVSTVCRFGLLEVDLVLTGECIHGAVIKRFAVVQAAAGKSPAIPGYFQVVAASSAPLGHYRLRVVVIWRLCWDN